MVDSIAVSASSFKPLQNLLLRYEVEVRYKPSILDNVKHWQVFEDDEQVKRIIEVIGEFSNSTIDQEEEKEVDQKTTSWEDTLVGHKILQLKANTIPRGLVPLEIILIRMT